MQTHAPRRYINARASWKLQAEKFQVGCELQAGSWEIQAANQHRSFKPSQRQAANQNSTTTQLTLNKISVIILTESERRKKLRTPPRLICACGGMADAADLKSAVPSDVWVQVPPCAPPSSQLVKRRVGYRCYVVATVNTDYAGSKLPPAQENAICGRRKTVYKEAK